MGYTNSTQKHGTSYLVKRVTEVILYTQSYFLRQAYDLKCMKEYIWQSIKPWFISFWSFDNKRFF